MCYGFELDGQWALVKGVVRSFITLGINRASSWGFLCTFIYFRIPETIICRALEALSLICSFLRTAGLGVAASSRSRARTRVMRSSFDSFSSCALVEMDGSRVVSTRGRLAGLVTGPSDLRFAAGMVMAVG